MAAKKKWKRDNEGNLIDPPVIPEFEQRLIAAHNASDDTAIAQVQKEYNSARDKLAGDKTTTRSR